MLILGLDPASTTGYAVIRGDSDSVELIEFGQIVCQSSFTLPQKLNFIHTCLQNLLTRIKPDVCAIEEPPLSISGVKVLIQLARINGVVIQSCFVFFKDNIHLFEPPYWKAHSFQGLNGSAPKWKVQLEVCRSFGIKTSIDIGQFDKKVISIQDKLKYLYTSMIVLKKQTDQLKKETTRKRNPLNVEDKLVVTNKLKGLRKELEELKKNIKDNEKVVNKELETVGRDVCAQTGLTSDVADATAIAFCLYRQLFHPDKI